MSRNVFQVIAWAFAAFSAVLLVASLASHGHGFLDTEVITSPMWAWVVIALLGAGWVTLLLLADPPARLPSTTLERGREP